MTSNFQKDWRDLDDSLALDVTLIESVFYQLCKRKRNQRLDLKSFEDEEMTQFEKKMFSKADVLSALEKTDGYLEKRPWLRVLHTQLACISISRDGLTLQDFLCSRQRDRTVCLSDIRRQLETIYANAKRSKEIEDKHKASVNHARAVSPWCVYNFKWLHSSPAKQLYNVHPIPQAKTKLQLTAEVVGSQARAIVNAIVGLALDKLVAFYLTQGLPNEIQTDRRLAVGILSLKPSRQRDVKLNCERETKLQALRLELFAPTAKFLVGNGKLKGQNSLQQVLMDLAMVETQGDPHLAHLLLENKIVHSGLSRAAEQAQRLRIKGQTWAIVKLWRDLHRAPTLQAMKTASKSI